MSDDRLREQLVRILAWEEAHVGFDKAVDGIPVDKRGVRASGFEHTLWELLEHMRIAQADILDFSVNAEYVHNLKWPDDYWPASPSPPTASAWDHSVASFREDRAQLTKLAREIHDLYARVPTGKGQQTYIRAILLVADHNSYHLGQLVALRKALGVWS
jgi:hypothetical protein